MTEDPVYKSQAGVSTSWNAGMAAYRLAQSAIFAEWDKEDDVDLPDALSKRHHEAGLALLYVPARTPIQVAQKLRVADNLFYLRHVHPDVVDILLDDLLNIAGLDAGDVPALPPQAK